MSIRVGYKASPEQFSPSEVVTFATRAEELGFDFVAVSDHFQPFRHSGGHSGFSLACLGAIGERTSTISFGTSVLTPTLRYHPAVVAQAFATLACLSPNRVFLGVGTGEAMNEVPSTGRSWPSPRERLQRLGEAITLIRELWDEPRVSFAGRWFETRNATIYDRPDAVVPIYVAASAVGAAALAGRHGDGLITTSGKDRRLYPRLLQAFRSGARDAQRDPGALTRLLEVKISYARDLDQARSECGWWDGLALSRKEKIDIDDPVELERRACAVVGGARARFIVADNPRQVVAALIQYRAQGFDSFLVHSPARNQLRFLDEFSNDVLPSLRAIE